MSDVSRSPSKVKLYLHAKLYSLTAARRYRWALGALAGFAGGSFLLSTLWSNDELLHKLFASLSEALVISLVIAFVVEPYTRRRYVHEITSDAIWGFLNPNSPLEYRQVLGRLAASDFLYGDATWHLSLDWLNTDKAHIRVRIRFVGIGKNISIKPSQIRGEAWVLSSTDGYASAFESFRLSAPAARITKQYDARQLAAKVRQKEDDGTLFLDKGDLTGGVAIPSQFEFEYEICTSMTRHSIGYVPLVYSHPAMVNRMTIAGTAVPDLVVRVMSPGGESVFIGQTEGLMDEKKTGTLVRGQNIFVSWKPKLPDQPADELSVVLDVGLT